LETGATLSASSLFLRNSFFTLETAYSVGFTGRNADDSNIEFGDREALFADVFEAFFGL